MLIPIVGLIIALHLISVGGQLRALFPHRYPTRLGARFFDATGAFLSFAFFAALVLPLAYGLQGFQQWFFGLERFLKLAQEGQPAFFLGEYSYQGWWSYYLVAFLIKTPLGSLMLMVLSLLASSGPATGSNPREAVFLLLPVIVILPATTQAKVNIGLRHILLNLSFFSLFSRRGSRQSSPSAAVGRRNLLIGMALIFTIVSSLRVAPHQLAYFNEIIGGPNQGYRYLADSNLDWGTGFERRQGIYGQGETPDNLFFLFWPGVALLLRHSLPIRALGLGHWNGRRQPIKFQLRRSVRFSPSAPTTCKMFSLRTVRFSNGCAREHPS